MILMHSMESHSHQLPNNFKSCLMYFSIYIGLSEIYGRSFLLYSLRFPLSLYSFTSVRYPRPNIPLSSFTNTLRTHKFIYPLLNSTNFLIKCSCLGASLCFLMSSTLAKQLVLTKFPALFKKFNGMVNKNRHNLFWYMLFLRLTPLVPNWFVNLGSPLVGIPYKYFLGASIIGLMPMNFILMKTGQTLKEI